MTDQIKAQTNDLNDPEYRHFVQNVIDNIKKNGFPDRKVAFGLEKLYEAAEKKDINLNKVLQTLDDIKIAHEKTPDKIVFFPKPEQPAAPEIPADGVTGFDTSMFAGIDPSLFAKLDPSIFEGLDLNNLKNMSLPQMISVVGRLMKNLTPEQLQSIKGAYDNMSDDQKAAIMDKAKDLASGKKDKPKDD